MISSHSDCNKLSVLTRPILLITAAEEQINNEVENEIMLNH